VSRGITKKTVTEAEPEPVERRDPARGSCDRREEILDAATCLFAEHGFSDAVTQLLADRLGVGKGTLYRYFPSKRELFLAAADRVMRRMQEQVELSVKDATDPLDSIQRAVRTFLDFFKEHPEYVELLAQERALFKDREKPTYLEHRERHVERWRTLYRDQISLGRVRKMSVERISNVVVSAIYGAMFLNYSSGKSHAFEVRGEDILDVIFFGILSEPERRGRGADQA
jgi:AcrR family transcriptional regulator